MNRSRWSMLLLAAALAVCTRWGETQPLSAREPYRCISAPASLAWA